MNLLRMKLGLWITLLVCGCQQQSSKENVGNKTVTSRTKHEARMSDQYADYVAIGAVDPSDVNKVESALKAVGISSLVEGSVVYGIKVPKQHRDEATKVLKNDAKERGYVVFWDHSSFKG